MFDIRCLDFYTAILYPNTIYINYLNNVIGACGYRCPLVFSCRSPLIFYRIFNILLFYELFYVVTVVDVWEYLGWSMDMNCLKLMALPVCNSPKYAVNTVLIYWHPYN